MRKLITHKWIEQNGFKVHRCSHCGLIHYWDNGFHQLMYKQGVNGTPMYRPKQCKRLFHCDKIN